MSSSKTSYPVLKDIDRPFKASLVSERKQVKIIECENKTVVIFSLEGGKTKTIEHKFKEPTGIAFLSVLDVVAVCILQTARLLFFSKNGDKVVNFTENISPVHVCHLFKGLGVPFSLHQAPAWYTK